MAIQQSDLIDFGNGIIGDDTFDIWRKKTNSIKVTVDSVSANLTSKINTDIGNLATVYIPSAGLATSVSTALQFTGPITFDENLNIGGSLLFSQSNKLKTDKEFDSSVQVTSTKVRAKNNLILGNKTYSVPSSPAINNSVLVAQTSGALSWANISDIFSASGGFTQTTTVFEEVMPVGTVIPLAAGTNDPNFLLCEGGQVSKNDYQDLYNVLKNGTNECIYGDDGDENGFFTLPDYSGRVLVGTGGTTPAFSSTFGVSGGTNDRSTSAHNLTIEEMPRHDHVFVPSTLYSTADTLTNQPPDMLTAQPTNGNTTQSSANLPANSFIKQRNYLADTGGEGAEILNSAQRSQYNLDGIGKFADGEYGSSKAHSHTISPSARIQPYVTVKWFIKAKKNSKINFGINIANSGLSSTNAEGAGQTLISPVDETITLKAQVDNTSIRVHNGNIAIKEAPFIEGTITTTGPDLKIDNATRRGTFTNAADADTRRSIVHGHGNHPADPTLNGYNRKTVSTNNDSINTPNNDTLIINYHDVSPNSVGDYTNGVIINGVRALMFQDGSIIQSGAVPKKGNFKKAAEPASGTHDTVGPSYADSFMYIDDEDDLIIGGNGHGLYSTGGTSGYDDVSTTHAHRSKFMLPDGEKADKVYRNEYSTHVISKTGKVYGVGYGYSVAALTSTAADHTTNSFKDWTRCFCESNNCKFTKVIKAGDVSVHTSFALDEQGYLWGHGVNGGYGVLANGTTTQSGAETSTSADSTSIPGKREALANIETAAAGVPYNLVANRQYLPHIMNPMLDTNGDITTDVNNGVSLLKAIDAASVGSYSGHWKVHFDTVAMIGSNNRVYVAGYGDQGQCGDGSGTATNTHWVTVLKTDGTPLENIEKIYVTGEDAYTAFYAIDSSGDAWGWGNNGGGIFGLGHATDVLFATKIWDSQAKGYKASYVLSNNAGGETGAGSVDEYQSYIVSNETSAGVQTDKRVWFSAINHALSLGNWTQLTHTVFDVNNFEIQDMYLSNGNNSSFVFILARNKTTSKLELYSAGTNSAGELGYHNPNNPADFTLTSINGGYAYHRVNFDPDLLEKVVTIHCSRQYNVSGNTHVHLSDGRIFAVGRIRWSFGKGGFYDEYFYKFTPIMMD